MSYKQTHDSAPPAAPALDRAELLERLGRIETTTLHDADKGLRVPDPGIRPIRPNQRLLGPAVTVAAHDDLMSVMAALQAAQPGDVLVIDTAGSTRAVTGDLFANEAQRRGVAGMVIDGFCRDAAELRGLTLGFYARGTTPRAAPAVAQPSTGIVVQCGGVEVSPGDIVLGDDDGLVIGTPAEMAAAVPLAEAIQDKEAAMRSAVQANESLFTKLNYDEHLARLQAGEESKLQFLV